MLTLELFSLNESSEDLSAEPVELTGFDRIVFTPDAIRAYRGAAETVLEQPADAWVHEGKAYSDVGVAHAAENGNEPPVQVRLLDAAGKPVYAGTYPFVQGTYTLFRVGPEGDFLGAQSEDGGYVPYDDPSVPPFAAAEVR